MLFENFFVSLHEISFIMPRGCNIAAMSIKHHAEQRCCGTCFSSVGVIGNQDVTTVYFC